MKIALFENSKIMREITKTAAPSLTTVWHEYSHLGEEAKAAFTSQTYDAIITSKEFSSGSLKDIVAFAQSTYQNKETPIFLFTSDMSKTMVDEAFDIGVTDIFFKQELPALSDSLRKIEMFPRCVKGAHVLMLEDNRSVSDFYTHLLNDIHCVVHQANTCEAAEALLEQHPIELVITDLNLEEGGQGQRVIRNMRHNQKVVLHQIPIMVLSSCDTAQLQTGLFFLGIDEYLVKPALPLQFSLRAVNLIRKFRVFQQSQNQALELKEIAHFDKLTKVYNRHGFEDIATFCIANCQRQLSSVLGIMYIDLDNFKPINDSLGHQVGDEVLVEIARILKVELREQDIVARWGGDEFVVLLNQCDVKFIKAICARIEAKIFSNHKALHNVTCSIGVGFDEPKNYAELEKLIEQADSKMYEHKRQRKLQNQ